MTIAQELIKKQNDFEVFSDYEMFLTGQSKKAKIDFDGQTYIFSDESKIFCSRWEGGRK